MKSIINFHDFSQKYRKIDNRRNSIVILSNSIQVVDTESTIKPFKNRR